MIAEAATRGANDFGEEWIYAGEDTPLLSGGAFSSITMVALIMDVEQALEDATGTSVPLSTDAFMSATRSPLSTVSTFADFILEQIPARPQA